MRLLRHRTALFLLIVTALWIGWEGFLAASAPGRVDAAVRLALDREPRINVAVALGFPPVRGTTVLLNRVRPEDVRRIARYYWVRRITLQ
jgi:hypothetical protein